MLPVMDGYHVTRAVIEKLGAKSPKIVLMTSRDLSKETGIALMSGSDLVLQKPFKLFVKRATKPPLTEQALRPILRKSRR